MKEGKGRLANTNACEFNSSAGLLYTLMRLNGDRRAFLTDGRNSHTATVPTDNATTPSIELALPWQQSATRAAPHSNQRALSPHSDRRSAKLQPGNCEP
ncbi:hypothetical protein QQF64_028502 [Cirrhinus molitorella]|uniref:Uncharacterized protein n=1 Tax=Cirrhinus molitorella TaxID=172907 RepID=A0ABR3N6T3_9TELE